MGNQRLLSKASAKPGGVVVAPDEGHIRLPLKVIDDTIAARTSVPAIAGDHQLLDRQVADCPNCEMRELEGPIVVDEGVDKGVVIGGAIFTLRVRHQFAEQFTIIHGKDTLGLGSRIASREQAHEFEQLTQRGPIKRTLRFDIGQRRCQPGECLARIEDQRQKFFELSGIETSREGLFDQRPKRPRGVINDVSKLLILAVNITYDMDAPLGKCTFRGETGRFGESGIEIRKLALERPQVGQLGFAQSLESRVRRRHWSNLVDCSRCTFVGPIIPGSPKECQLSAQRGPPRRSGS